METTGQKIYPATFDMLDPIPSVKPKHRPTQQIFVDRKNAKIILHSIHTTIQCDTLGAAPIVIYHDMGNAIDVLNTLMSANMSATFMVTFDLRYKYIHNQYEKTMPHFIIEAAIRTDPPLRYSGMTGGVGQEWVTTYIVDCIYLRLMQLLGDEYWEGELGIND